MGETQAIGRLLFPHGQFRSAVLLAMVRRRWFVRLRWIIVGIVLGLLALEAALAAPPDGFQRPRAVLVTILALVLVNVAWSLVGRFAFPLSSTSEAATSRQAEASPELMRRVTLFANAQMIVDLLFLTVLLRYLGGVENPMALFYLFHMLIAALLLRPLNALLQGVWALLLYGALTVGECTAWIQPHYPFMPATVSAGLHTQWEYVAAAIGVLAAGVFGTLFFTLQISVRLDEQECALQQTHGALSRSQESLRKLHVRRSRFLQTAAHQLKSPLATIETLAGLLRDRTPSDAQMRDLIDRMIERCRTGTEQVSELLTLERIEQADHGRHENAATDVGEVARLAAVPFAERASAKNIRLIIDAPSQDDSGTLAASVDRRDLDDCIANLLDNAVKYTPAGGEVRLQVFADARDVYVSVKDSGMGIAESSPDDLFDPFRRGNAALAAGISGSGLGLTIVREVLEQCGGGVNVRSSPGRGAEFVLRLPRTAARGTRRDDVVSSLDPSSAAPYVTAGV